MVPGFANLVRMTGLEPVRPLQAPAPQAGQSTYSSTSANQHGLLYQLFFICQLKSENFFIFLGKHLTASMDTPREIC